MPLNVFDRTRGSYPPLSPLIHLLWYQYLFPFIFVIVLAILAPDTNTSRLSRGRWLMRYHTHTLRYLFPFCVCVDIHLLYYRCGLREREEESKRVLPPRDSLFSLTIRGFCSSVSLVVIRKTCITYRLRSALRARKEEKRKKEIEKKSFGQSYLADSDGKKAYGSYVAGT